MTRTALTDLGATHVQMEAQRRRALRDDPSLQLGERDMYRRADRPAGWMRSTSSWTFSWLSMPVCG